MLQINEKNFEKQVLRNKQLILVDFWAPWCGVCQMMGPIFDEVAKEFTGKMEFGKVNVDENSVLSDKYKITAIPTLIFFKNGKIIDKAMGLLSKEELAKKLNTFYK